LGLHAALARFIQGMARLRGGVADISGPLGHVTAAHDGLARRTLSSTTTLPCADGVRARITPALGSIVSRTVRSTRDFGPSFP
jgi:hypothetical protein